MIMTKVIVIVCVSNTCRSPMVEYLLRDMIKREIPETYNNYKVISRSLSTQYEPPNSPASAQGIKVLMEDYNLNMESHQSTLLTIKDVEDAYLIIPVKKDLGEYILNCYPSCSKEKIKNFNQDISDPWRSSEAVFRSCAQLIYQQLEQILPSIIEK